MNKTFPSVRDDLLHEFAIYKSKAYADKRRQEEPLRDKQLNFWLESAIYWIVQLPPQEKEKAHTSDRQAFNKARESLDRLRGLLD
jgi:hypothetical protein